LSNRLYMKRREKVWITFPKKTSACAFLQQKKLLPQNLTWRQQLWHSHPAIWMTQGTRSILSFPSTILSLVRYQSGIMHNAMSYKNTIVGVTIGTRKQTICHFFACNNANCLLVFLINYISIYV
jgi:hypothetical protein